MNFRHPKQLNCRLVFHLDRFFGALPLALSLALALALALDLPLDLPLALALPLICSLSSMFSL